MLSAKTDTGAELSSLYTAEYQVLKKDGKEWVRFAIADKKGKSERIEAPLLRYAKIKQKDNLPSNTRRVILLCICMGNRYKVVEVNLLNRSNFDFPMLVGRSFLHGNYVVDADYKYLAIPDCGWLQECCRHLYLIWRRISSFITP